MAEKKLRPILKILLSIAFIVSIAYLIQRDFLSNNISAAELTGGNDINSELEDYLETRKNERLGQTDDEDPFGDDDVIRILLIGLDSRVGESSAHCDAIQLFEINRQNKTVSITAVPRGTYSPLPAGTGEVPSDYYVSNACALGGIDYGVEQIEYILGKKADYLVMVGFSETIGILRYFDLPTTETLQWLRQRQGYAIGEPQRARNHSTFLKQMMIIYIPQEYTAIDTAFHYILYKLIKTDLSFNQTQQIITELIDMDLVSYPERVSLSMRPWYDVQDISYDPDNVNEYVQKMIDPIKHLLTQESFSDEDKETVQQNLLSSIESQSNDPEFIKWAYENDLWMQIENDEVRLNTQFAIITSYLDSLPDKEARERLIADYILEMQYTGLTEWEEKGKELLEEELGN